MKAIEATHALVLAGGQSRRMGEDKAAMRVGDQDLLARTVALAESHSDAVFVGVRDARQVDALRARYACLSDSVEGQGPLASILAALSCDPGADWLVLACDMPCLDEQTLAALCADARSHPDAKAIALSDSSGTLPEPLCAIWRAPLIGEIRYSFEQSNFCARKCLIRAGARLVQPVNADAIINMNTPTDAAAANVRSLRS
ncbi:MAG: molybdenum cofactor guanylyltransferase [Pseudomonadota bacterium]